MLWYLMVCSRLLKPWNNVLLFTPNPFLLVVIWKFLLLNKVLILLSQSAGVKMSKSWRICLYIEEHNGMLKTVLRKGKKRWFARDALNILNLLWWILTDVLKEHCVCCSYCGISCVGGRHVYFWVIWLYLFIYGLIYFLPEQQHLIVYYIQPFFGKCATNKSYPVLV